MANGIVLGPDSVTLGRWIGKFGGGGYWTVRANGGSIPSWITALSVTSAGTGTLTLANTDNYFQVPGEADSNTYGNYTTCNIDLTMADANAYVTSVYILSTTSTRRLAFKLQNSAGDTTYWTYTDPAFWGGQGKWYRFLHWGGSCRLRLENISGVTTLCGITFDKYDGQFGNYCEE